MKHIIKHNGGPGLGGDNEMGDYDAPINHPLWKRFPRDRQPFIVSSPMQLSMGYPSFFYEPSLRIGRLRKTL